MDSPASTARAFRRLVYFDPFMFVSLSGSCATSKLIQCRSFGIGVCDVSPKFEKDVSEVPDLHPKDFRMRRKVVNYVRKWCSKSRARGEWTPILYAYEIVQGSANKSYDAGHLVFTDPSLQKFLLVMCFGASFNDHGELLHDGYDAITKQHADRWFSLCTYLNHDKCPPEWVRATYTTDDHLIDPSFLNSTVPPPPKSPGSREPAIYHVTADTFVPGLNASELNKINKMLNRRSTVPRPIPPLEVRKRVERPREWPSMWIVLSVVIGCAACLVYCYHLVSGRPSV